jgi:hypothetical protein
MGLTILKICKMEYDAFQEQCLKWILNYTTSGNGLVSIKFS